MGSLAERDALSCEGEEWQKITGNIRFRVREPQAVIPDRYHMTGDIRTRTDICLVEGHGHSTQTTRCTA